MKRCCLALLALTLLGRNLNVVSLAGISFAVGRSRFT